ncbi:hypothetical protein PR048_016472 [Dryococelus australis]|uniref:Uncharacterized protein n=1 Tax=Dryococelus australis TaxID=614101 RepID=A0ABQ9HK15_9NEOP|nr:hypothetical protein PR048_016472 [Dryococelus australis]
MDVHGNDQSDISGGKQGKEKEAGMEELSSCLQLKRDCLRGVVGRHLSLAPSISWTTGSSLLRDSPDAAVLNGLANKPPATRSIKLVRWPPHDPRPLPSSQPLLPRGHAHIFPPGYRAGPGRWSAGFLGDLPFPRHLHSGAAPFSPHFSLSALKTSMLRAAEIAPLHYPLPPPPSKYIAASAADSRTTILEADLTARQQTGTLERH